MSATPPPPAASPPPPNTHGGENPPPGFGVFKLFCLLSVLFQFCILCLGGIAFWLSTDPLRDLRGMPNLDALAPAMFWSGILLAAMSLPLIVAYGAAPFLPHKPWAWKVNLSLIGMGVATPVFFLAIPAGKRWNDPAMRQYYGLPPTPPVE